MDRYAAGKKTKKRRGQKESRDRSGYTQKAAAERRCEFRLQYQNDGHREPVGTVPRQDASQTIAYRDHDGKANGVTKRRRLQIQIRAQGRQQATKAQPPGLLRPSV